jgi:non-ribosomal peptide synthetase component F
MRGPLDVMKRWWHHGNGNGNGRGHGNGHGNGNGNGNGDAPAADEVVEPPRPQMPPQPWLAQLDREGIPRSLHYPTTTLGRIVDQAAERFGDRHAIVYNQTRWTYCDLLARVNRLAGWAVAPGRA